MSPPPSPGRVLRERIASDGILVAPGAYDAITARAIEAHGFDAVYVTGAGTVNAQLGLPDISLGTMTEIVDNARRIAQGVSVPVFCDADTGYGNAVNVMRTVREFEQAGVAGIHLEDQVTPKRCGHLEGKEIVDTGEMVGKIRAACEARRDDDFVVIARSDAAAVEGVEASVERCRAYAAAGADVIFSEALTTEADFRTFAEAGIGAPLLANMTEFGRTPYLSASEFEAIGYDVVIFPMLAFRSMLKAVDDALSHLRAHGTQADILDRMKTREELYELVDYPSYDEHERRFVREVDLGG
ncbi:methylisocitrate lyase [Egibacter rhizosphaerae]|uniref:Methylisocitrate lyase n=1 Tax=Egibacter rhizosphaerae TaxID=1670831 RepID=A0A411YHB7_9ACTN|nr:methylisocitrate lyase [Egibacter rhizosphaerae]QBI20511.1 methylisocitrate lyase [Egibacter rhizosphaerae]